MAIAVVALFAALSGVAVALPGRNTVDSGDIKNGQVRGPDVDEDTLGTVPSAANAARVSGLEARAFHYREASNTPETTILSLGGLTLRARCDTGGDTRIFARTDTDNSLVWADDGSGDADFDTGDVDSVEGPGNDVSSVVYRRGGAVAGSTSLDGPAVSVTFGYVGPEGPQNDCLAVGTALGTP